VKPSTQQTIDACISRHKGQPGGLLPLLHAVQQGVGFIPESAVADIARGMNLSRAEVHGVISFYHDFLTAPPAQHRVKICRAEACQAMGSRELEAHVRQRLGDEAGAGGSISVEPVYCFGNCACSPSVEVDGKLYARVNAQRIDRVLDGLIGTGESS
jgi:formate dehydrogenase subunit gamma